MITGHIETPSGSPVFENKVYLTPNLGRSAKFNGDGYVFWFDKEISTNKQFDGLSGDYTVETWFRTLHTQQQTLFAAVDSSSTNHYIHVEITDEGQVRYQHNSTPGG